MHLVPALLALGLALIVPAHSFWSTAFAGEALTTNQLSDSLSIVDTDTMKAIAEVKLSGKPAGIALSPDRRFAFVTAPEGKELIEVDVVARAVSRRLKMGAGPLGIAAHPARAEIYVADWYDHKISVIELPALTVSAEISVGQSPSGLAVSPDGTRLISTDRDSDQISIIDIAKRAVMTTIATGKRPFGVTIDPEGRTAYTANVASNDVSVVDIAAQKIVRTIKVGQRPYAVALASGRGFVTDQYTGTVTVFKAATGAVERTLEACDHPEGIEAGADEAHVYVACWGDNIVLKIDAETLKIIAKASVGDGPRAFGKFLR